MVYCTRLQRFFVIELLNSYTRFYKCFINILSVFKLCKRVSIQSCMLTSTLHKATSTSKWISIISDTIITTLHLLKILRTNVFMAYIQSFRLLLFSLFFFSCVHKITDLYFAVFDRFD